MNSHLCACLVLTTDVGRMMDKVFSSFRKYSKGSILVYHCFMMIMILFFITHSRIKMNYNVFTLRIRKTLNFTHF